MKLNTITKKVILLTVTISATIIIVLLLSGSSTQFSIDNIKQVIKSFGSLGPLIFIGLYTLSIVISPVAGGPFIVASLVIFGFSNSLLYIYAGNLTGAIINFFIARKLGRPIITKFIGVKSMKQVDEIAGSVGVKILMVLRLIGIGAFDLVSYAVGLTSMSFYIYFLVTATCSIPSLAIIVYMMDRAVRLPKVFSVLAFIGIYSLAIAIPLYLYRRQKTRKDSKKLPATNNSKCNNKNADKEGRA